MKTIKELDLMVSLKISEFYPSRIAFIAVQDEKSDLWDASVFSIEENSYLGDMLFCFDEYIYKSEQDAIRAIKITTELAMDRIKLMSN